MFTADPVTAYRWIAAPLPFFASLAACRIANLRPHEAVFFLAFGMTSPLVVMWNVGGLETPVLTALITLFFSVVARVIRRGKIDDSEITAAALLAAACVLTRHDSAAALVAPCVAFAALCWRRPRLWTSAAAAAATVSAWLLFAQIYFGSAVPTSAFVKLGQESAPIANNLIYMTFFGLFSGMVFLPIRRWAMRGLDGPGKWMIPACGVSAVGIAIYFAHVGSAHMMFGYRAATPYIPAIGLAAAMLASERARACGVRIAAFNLLLAAYIFGVSINPVFPGLVDSESGEPRFEYSETSLGDYAAFMAGVENAATAIQKDWSETGDDARQPHIFLYTGGMGYWLRDFYVYETLVSYRHDCRTLPTRAFWSVDYAQDMDFYAVGEINQAIQTWIDRGPAAHAETRVVISEPLPLDGGNYIAIRGFGEPPPYALPLWIGGRCSP